MWLNRGDFLSEEWWDFARIDHFLMNSFHECDPSPSLPWSRMNVLQSVLHMNDDFVIEYEDYVR